MCGSNGHPSKYVCVGVMWELCYSPGYVAYMWELWLSLKVCICGSCVTPQGSYLWELYINLFIHHHDNKLNRNRIINTTFRP